VRRAALAIAIAVMVLTGCGSKSSTRNTTGGALSGTTPVENSQAGGPTTSGASSAGTTPTPVTAPHGTSPRPGVPPAAASSGVQGVVTAGPTCPVQRADTPCPPRPVEVDVTAHNSSGAVVATTHSAADGTYAMKLSPGSYTLDVPSTNKMMRCAEVPVTVEAGKTARADISCDTGIR
jgi:hypothetical protein